MCVVGVCAAEVCVSLSLLLGCTRELCLCVAVCVCVYVSLLSATSVGHFFTTLFFLLTFFLFVPFFACVVARVIFVRLLAVLAILCFIALLAFLRFFGGGAGLLFGTRLGPLLRQPGPRCRA